MTVFGSLRTVSAWRILSLARAPHVVSLAAALAAAPLAIAPPLAAALLGQTALVGQQPSRSGLLDYMEQIRNDNDLPGLSVAVAVDGEIVFSEGVGYAELDNRTPATGRTVHNVGSVSKVLAVVGLMQLVEQGRVDLDATIQTYMPWYPEREFPITVRHILTHTSGIRHYNGVEFGPYDLLSFRHYDTFEEATELWRDDPLAYDTGSGWMYSSHAHNLQHGIVEAASGMDYEEYLKRHVWEPAGMFATQFDVPRRVVRNRGRGYIRGESGRFINPPPEDPSYKYAGGGIISSVEDLVRFALAINDGRLLAPETVAEMHRPQLEPGIREIDPTAPGGLGDPIGHEQALAWFIRTDQAGRRYPSHPGTVKGTRSFLGNWNDYGVVVAIQTNALPFDSARYGEAIAQMFLP